MALFRPNFDRPGPGVDPNAPRKTGLARLWEIFARDTLGLPAAGALGAMFSTAIAAWLVPQGGR